MLIENWCVAFRDEDEELYRDEVIDDDGDYLGLNDIVIFNSKKLADKFILEKTDSCAYDFYSKPFTESELLLYGDRYKCGFREIDDEKDFDFYNAEIIAEIKSGGIQNDN